MTLLYQRKSILTVGTTKIVSEVDASGVAGLDIAFSVEKTLADEPNTADITVWGLNPDRRRALEASEEIPVRLEAGYQERTFQIFAGDLREAVSIRDGADWVTTIGAGDGEKKHRRSRINQGFSAGTSLEAILRALVNKMGVGVGNLDAFAATAALEGAGAVFPEGTVLSGRASRELRRVVRSAGLEFSIQNGTLQLLARGLALVGTAVVLNSGTGLIGVPSVDSKGVLTAQTLMVPDVFPGRKIKIESGNLTGLFRVDRATYTGDTATADWFIEIEGKPL